MRLKFYCRHNSEEGMEQLKLLEVLLDKLYQPRIHSLNPGECVLARWDSVWRGAEPLVIEAMFAG